MSNKTISNSAKLVIANSLMRVSYFIINILVARFTNQEIFGQFMMIRSAAATIDGATSSTFGNLVIKETTNNIHNNLKTYENYITTLIFNTVIIAISLLIFILIDTQYKQIISTNSNNSVIIFILFTSLMFTSLNSSASNSIAIGANRYNLISKSGFASLITSTLICPLLIYYFRLIGGIASLVLIQTVEFYIKTSFFKKEKLINFNPAKKFQQFIIPVSTIFLAGLINLGIFWIIRVFYVSKSDSFSGVAIFDASYQIISIIMFITGALATVTLQMISNKNITKYEKRKIFISNIKINIIVVIIGSIATLSFIDIILSIYGSNYSIDLKTKISLTCILTFQTISSLFSKYFISIDKYKIILICTTISAITILTLSQIINIKSVFCITFLFSSFHLIYFLSIITIYYIDNKNEN